MEAAIRTSPKLNTSWGTRGAKIRTKAVAVKDNGLKLELNY